MSYLLSTNHLQHNHLILRLSYFTRSSRLPLHLLFLIWRGDGFLNEATAQVRSLINQDRIKCALGEQLAEDHLATLSMLLSDACAQLNAGTERACYLLLYFSP